MAASRRGAHDADLQLALHLKQNYSEWKLDQEEKIRGPRCLSIGGLESESTAFAALLSIRESGLLLRLCATPIHHSG